MLADQNIFTFDIARCNGCYNCQLACKDEHAGNNWPPYASAQPDVGQFWIKVQENVCGTMPKVKIHYIPTLCNHCANPVCVAACLNNAAYRRTDGLVILNPEACMGCQACAKACPYGAIYYNVEENLCQKCTGCAHLLDNGDTQPRCVEACPTEALRFGTQTELKEAVSDSVVMHPETGCAPNVYYRNIPGKFISGTVYDPVEKEVVIGARCVLTGGGKELVVHSDAYGDFWHKDLAAVEYALLIEAKGFVPKAFPVLNAADCLNLGDIPLERE